jgi:HK97 family phage portal protein
MNIIDYAKFLWREIGKDAPVPMHAEQKSIAYPVVMSGTTASWPEISWARLRNEGYNTNAVVGACLRALAFKFPEPQPLVKTADRNGNLERVAPTHPLQRLLTRPNRIMSHNELAVFQIIYMAVGGQCYLHKVRSGAGRVVELWPYHAGHISPVPSATDWVSEYEYDVGDGRKSRIPANDIVHLKWPMPDLAQPWMSLPPLRQVAREVDADSEMTRMIYALLRNDATPWTIINVKTELSETAWERFKTQWYARHGGDAKGGISVLEGDATIERLALNLQELDISALRRIPEARICAAFGVPPAVVGMYVGLEKMTYSNAEEARKMFTQDTLVPLWNIVAGELEQDLGPEFGDGLVVEYDTSRVAALQEDENGKYTRNIEAWKEGVITHNEVRGALGFAPVEDLGTGPGDVFATSPAPVAQPPIDVQPIPPRLLEAASRLPAELKQRRDDVTADIQTRMAADLERYLKRQYEKPLENVRG